MAIVSDRQFVQAIMNLMRPFVPAVEIKTFGAQEYEKALAFPSEMPALKTAKKPAMKLTETNDPKIIGYEINGTLTEADVEKVMPALQQAFEKEEKNDPLARVKNFRGFDPSILTKPSFFSMKLSAITHVRRNAVVGAPGWMKNVAGMVGSMLPIAMRFSRPTRKTKPGPGSNPNEALAATSVVVYAAAAVERPGNYEER